MLFMGLHLIIVTVLGLVLQCGGAALDAIALDRAVLHARRPRFLGQAAGSPHADSIAMAQGEKPRGGGMCCSAGDNGFCQNTTEATDWARKETVP